MKVHSFIRDSLQLILHIIALAIVFFAYLSIAQWYFFHRPILGVDFFNTATYSRFLSDHFHILPYGFKYFWYGGSPIAEEIVLSWFFPFSFFARMFPLIESVKIASLFFFSLLVLFTYLACYRLSRNQFVSVLITMLVVYSANMYGALVWGGSLPYFANQLFFPLVLWVLACYLQTGNKRWYYLSILIVGLSFLGHLSNGTAFVFVGSVVLIMFGTRAKSVSFVYRIREVIILFLISYFFASRVTEYFRGLLVNVLKGGFSGLGGGSVAKVSIGTGGVQVSGDSSLIAFERSHFQTLFSDTHTFLFVLFAVAVVLFLVGFVFDRKKKNALAVVAWVLLAGYSVVHVFLNSYGISFLNQAWYRAFWHFPITIGVAAAALLGYSFMAFKSFSKLSSTAVFLLCTVFSIAIIGWLLSSHTVDQTIKLLETRSSPSSAHPEAINLVRNQKELEFLKKKLVPRFLDPNGRNYRLFTSDAQVNVWWNALFDMPLAAGYIDPPLGSGVLGNNFLLDQSVAGDGLVTNFKYPEDASKNMAMYHIDWYAVKYLEGGRLSKSPNKGPSSYLKDAIEESQDAEVKGAYILYETKSGKPEVWEDVPQYLRYYQFKDELITPILSLTNSPSVLCFCSWPSYESLTKALSMNNINSKFLITVFYPQNLDSLSDDDLSRFDGVILTGYKYRSKNNAFVKLSHYVKNGGKLFIDTGSEIAESEDTDLPDVFPFRSAVHKGLGKDWDIEVSKDLVFANVAIASFSAPLYNEFDWKFSYPEGNIEEGVEVLLKNHGKPLLVRKSMGKGEVLWSGMNLAYHIHSNTNQEESKLYVNLLRSLVPLEIHKPIFGKPEFKNDRHVKFSSDTTGSGILFKEEFYQGWQAQVNGKEVSIYAAGPTFPGFLYVPLDRGFQGPVHAEFTYWGKLDYHYFPRLISAVIGLFLLDLAFLDGRILGKRIFAIVVHLRERVRTWWKREEE